MKCRFHPVKPHMWPEGEVEEQSSAISSKNVAYPSEIVLYGDGAETTSTAPQSTTSFPSPFSRSAANELPRINQNPQCWLGKSPHTTETGSYDRLVELTDTI